MATIEEARDGLIALIRNITNVFYPIICTVTSVDLDNKSCDVKPLNENAPILDVKIMTDPDKGMFVVTN